MVVIKSNPILCDSQHRFRCDDQTLCFQLLVVERSAVCVCRRRRREWQYLGIKYAYQRGLFIKMGELDEILPFERNASRRRGRRRRSIHFAETLRTVASNRKNSYPAACFVVICRLSIYEYFPKKFFHRRGTAITAAASVISVVSKKFPRTSFARHIRWN